MADKLSDIFSKWGYYIVIALIAALMGYATRTAQTDSRITALEQWRSQVDNFNLAQVTFQQKANSDVILALQKTTAAMQTQIDTELRALDVELAAIEQRLKDLPSPAKGDNPQ